MHTSPTATYPSGAAIEGCSPGHPHATNGAGANPDHGYKRHPKQAHNGITMPNGWAWRFKSPLRYDLDGHRLHVRGTNWASHTGPELISRTFARLARRAGLGSISLHDLRHMAASLMLAAGESPKVVAEILGHSSPVMAQVVYQHLMLAKLRRPANTALLTTR